MSITELKTKLEQAKKAYKANKEDKSLKLAYKNAKKAFEAAEAGDMKVEAAAVEAVVDIPTLQAACEAAKAAYKADKSNAELKSAYKAAKKTLEEAQASQPANSPTAKRKREDDEAVPAVKKVKTATDISSLEEACKTAKAAYKADKANSDLKKAYKIAKKALEDAQSAEAEPMDVVETEVKEEEQDSLSALKKSKPTAPAGLQDAAANEKCFVGNLSWDVDDDSVKEFFKDCGEIVDIFWLTNRDTGKFKGCGFLTFESIEASTKACEKAGQEFMGRELKINFATPRPGGDKKGFNKGGKGAKRAPRELSARPDNCTTVFAGNLSFNIDDDAMRKFAEDAGEIKNIRWLTDRETGDFKGCGFVEFYDSASVDNFVKKNGEDLMGRSVRLDYAAPRAPRN